MPGGFNHYEQSLRIVDVLENDGAGLNLTWEVRDGIARHSKGKRGVPVGAPTRAPRQHARRADRARRRPHRLRQPRHRRCGAGRDCCARRTCRRGAVAVLGATSSERIGRMVNDVVRRRRSAGGLHRDPDERPRCSRRRSSCAASCSRRSTRTTIATAEFEKAAGILGGLWEKVRERPSEFLDARTIDAEGLDVGGPRLPGRHDRPLRRRLFEQLFIPKPWVGPLSRPSSGSIAAEPSGFARRRRPDCFGAGQLRLAVPQSRASDSEV